MTDFQRNLQYLIDSRGITQRWLADAANTKEATISRYLKGVNLSPNVEILVNIAKALDVSTDFLLGLSDVQKQKQTISAEETVFISCLRQSSKDDKAVLYALFKKYMTERDLEILSKVDGVI